MNKKKIHKPDSIPIPEYQMESLARVLFPIIQEYLSSEEGQKDYAEWQQLQLNKQLNKENSPSQIRASNCILYIKKYN